MTDVFCKFSVISSHITNFAILFLFPGTVSVVVCFLKIISILLKKEKPDNVTQMHVIISAFMMGKHKNPIYITILVFNLFIVLGGCWL